MLTDIGMLIQKAKISTRFEGDVLGDEEYSELEKAKNLCELRIVELWNDQNSEEFKALCSIYFDIASQIVIDLNYENAVFDYLKIISFGYLGEGWHLVRQYLKNQQNKIDLLSISENWNSRLLNTSFKALVGLIRKNDWNDIKESIHQIEILRSEQAQFEQDFLNKVTEESRPYGASELVSLYHFAKSIEILANYLIEGRPCLLYTSPSPRD